jgi:platelet-activating factor acetylhydrolase
MVFGLRPLTPRRILVFTSASLLFWIFVFSLTPITSPLPPYTGPHEVGILDVETEVQKRVIHDAILKETGKNAFELETLAITLYYPSSLPTAPPSQRPWARPWLPQPISLIGSGYARLAGISFAPLQSLFTFGLWALGSSTVIPGVVDAPILSGAKKVLVDEGARTSFEQEHQELKRTDKLGTLPCVVFTHGMAGMSQSYSHYLGSIASHGYVVAAVEHRDGSGPGTIVHHSNGTESKVWHMKLRDLESNPPMTDLDLKEAQLAFRQAEISETIKLFAQLNAGDAPIVNLKPDSPRESLPGFKNRLNLAAVTVAGHSYGATGAMQALKTAGSKDMRINGGIALDPGKGSGPLNKDIDVPVLVMQSGEWTEKQTEFYGQGKHFDVVRRIVESVKEGWFMTLSKFTFQTNKTQDSSFND